jgi:hypothetical protein
MELYKVVAEASLTEALERSSLTEAIALSQIRGVVVDPACPCKEINSLAFRIEFFVQLFPRQKATKDADEVRS